MAEAWAAGAVAAARLATAASVRTPRLKRMMRPS
jgi:hypothetical protein